MGWDTYLFIDDQLFLSWRKHAPSQPVLLFQAEDLVLGQDSSSQGCIVRYETSVEAARRTLDLRGITRDFCERIYEDSGVDRGFVAGFLEGWLRTQFALEKAASDLDASSETCKSDRLQAAIASKRGSPPTGDELWEFGRYVVSDWRFESIEERSVLVYKWLDSSWAEPTTTDPADIALDAEQRGIAGAWLIGSAAEFFDHLSSEAPLVCWLILMRVVLGVLEDQVRLCLDLSDDAEQHMRFDAESPEEYANRYWDSSAAHLAETANKYSRLFGAIEGAASTTGPEYFRARARALLHDSQGARDPQAKGKLLEDLLEATVNINADEFAVVERNLRTHEEELDLVIANRSRRPFWLALQSPTIFVECKNWSARVGINELRVFESKLQDHESLCRVGVFVALAGVTAPFRNRLRELQARGRTVFLLSRADLASVIDHSAGLPGWIEDHGLLKSIASGAGSAS